MRMTSRDRDLLEGRCGPGAQMSMTILVRMAEIYDAEEMMDITQAHIDSAIYIGEAGLEFAEHLASSGAEVSVPTTLNVSGLDEHHWQDWNVPADWAEKAHRQMLAYQKLGCQPTWTCAPYQTEAAPRLGQQIAWGESNAIVFANSVSEPVRSATPIFSTFVPLSLAGSQRWDFTSPRTVPVRC